MRDYVALVVLLFTLPWMTRCDSPEITRRAVTFDRDLKPVVEKTCRECHHRSDNDWSIYQNASLYRSQIRTKVYIERTMPANRQFTEQQRILFRDWVDQGCKR